MNVAVELVAVVILPVVACGGENDYARIDQTTHRATNRIVAIRIDRRHAETHVDDANVVSRAIGSDPIECSQHLRGRTEALRVEHTQIDHVRMRSNANVLSM